MSRVYAPKKLQKLPCFWNKKIQTRFLCRYVRFIIHGPDIVSENPWNH